MGLVVATPEPSKVVLIGENSVVVVQQSQQALPIVLDHGPTVVVSPTSQVLPVVVESGGPQGPPGEAGSDLHFVFTQGAPSSKWVIKHNLGKFPSVLVEDSANDEVEGDIEYISLNELAVTFTSPFSGIAYLN